MDIDDMTREVEEVSSHYAERHAIDRTDDWFVLKLNEEVGELTQAYLARAGQVLLIAKRNGVDLTAAIERKWLVWKPAR